MRTGILRLSVLCDILAWQHCTALHIDIGDSPSDRVTESLSRRLVAAVNNFDDQLYTYFRPCASVRAAGGTPPRTYVTPRYPLKFELGFGFGFGVSGLKL